MPSTNGETSPVSTGEQPSDADRIEAGIVRAQESASFIDDATARVIASQLHDGQASALYAFASTGAIDIERMDAELKATYEAFDGVDPRVQQWAVELATYAFRRPEHGAVEGWSRQWPSMNDGLSDLQRSVQTKFAHLSDRELIARMQHAPDFGYDDEEVELTRRLGAQGLKWRWGGDFFRPSIEVYKPEDQQ